MSAPIPIWSPDVPLPTIPHLQLPNRISHIMLHRGDDDYRFLHESCIVHHRSAFFVAWNNSPRAESESGTVVRWIRSCDGFAGWSDPAPIAPAIDHPTTIWESCQLLSTDDTLWAFTGQVHSQPRQPAETAGRTAIFRFEDTALHWLQVGAIEGFHPLNRPQRMSDGRWAMGGQFNLNLPRVALSHGDDLLRWDVAEIASAPDDRINFAEASLAADGSTVTAYVRSAIQATFVSETHNYGRTWSPLRISNLPMSSSKTCAGILTSGQRYLAFNMAPKSPSVGARDVLAIAVSAPGRKHFCRIVPIRNARSPEARIAGFAKGPQWSYPSVVEHDGNVYVTYSVTKEDCCLSILPLGTLSV